MSTLSRYLCLIFLRFFAVILASMLSLYGLIEFIEKFDDFIEHDAVLADYLTYPLYNLPLMLSSTMPLAILLGAFASIASLSRTSQLTALFASGLNFRQISRPLFGCGLVFCVLSLVSHLWLVPWSTREAHYLLETRVKGNSPDETRSQNLIFRDGDQIISIENAFPDKGVLAGLTLIEFNEAFLPVQRIDAALAHHIGQGVWRFQEVAHWEFSPENQSVRSFARHAEQVRDLQRQPEDMLQLWTEPEQMSPRDLQHFINKLQAEGYNPSEYRVEQQMRLARAATPLIMILLGVPFALQRGRQVSFSLGVSISLAVFLIYYLLYATFTAIGTAGILPPPAAAWAANLLMILVGSWLFLNVRD